MPNLFSSRSAMQWLAGALATAMSSLLLIVAFGMPAPALAAPVSSKYPQVVVRYSDLNLGHPSGREVLNRRITSAARQVCGEEQYPSPAASAVKVAQCIDFAVSGAQAEIARRMAR